MKSDGENFGAEAKEKVKFEELKSPYVDHKKAQEEEVNEIDANRSEKFLSSRDEYKRKIIFQFLFVELIFIAYFLADYFDNHNVLQEVKTCLTHLKLSVERRPNIRFTEAFTLEELAEGSPVPVYKYTCLFL